MRILLDECLPSPLGRKILGHTVTTVQEAGWAGQTNGELLSLIAGHYDVFVTVDRNLMFQQRIANLTFGVVVLHAGSNRLSGLEPLVPRLLEVLRTIQAGQVLHLAVPEDPLR